MLRASVLTKFRKGMSLIYMTTTMSTLMLIVSLGVDYSRVQMAKTELQCAADAAARAAATGLATSASQARANAITVAGLNSADGSSVVLTNSNIDVGNWANGTFTLNGTPSNAVQVRAGRTSSAGNPVPLIFTRVLGLTGCDVRATSTAVISTSSPSGFIGLSSVTVKNNTFVGGYDSSADTTPSKAGSHTGGQIGSNGTITGGNNNDLYGTAILGPSGSITGFDQHGFANSVQASPIAAPTSPIWSPSTNPGGISQNYTVSSNTTLTGGTYYFTSLTIAAKLKFSGATTIYINGDVDIDGDLQPISLIPSDLMIYQIGTHTFGDSGASGNDIVAIISAPNSSFNVKNNLKFRGAAVFDTIVTKNSADFFYDTISGSSGGSTSVYIAK